MLRYADVVDFSVVDGPGIRTVVFMQGCPRHCPGCHNPATLDPAGGQTIGERELARKIIACTDNDSVSGLTLSGGDPLLQHERLYEVLTFVKKRKPHLNVWLYTGYYYEDVAELPLLNFVDVVVDGPFEEEKKALTLIYRGSANQRIIDVVASRATGKLILLETDAQGHLRRLTQP